MELNFTKRCTKCLIEKCIEDFRVHKKYKNDRRSICKYCESQYAKIWKQNETYKQKQRVYAKNRWYNNEKYRELSLVNNKKWRQDNSIKLKDYILKEKYGINLDDYNKILIKQDYKCLGCKFEHNNLKKYLSVDHCHKTGKIRGLLCRQCNLCVGNARDNIEILKNLIEYLKNNETLELIKKED